MKDTDLKNLEKHLHDEDTAREFLEQMRWLDGKPVCPHCKEQGAYKLTPKPESKSKVRKGVWKCAACRKQFTVTVGTIFEDSRIPLNKWLLAIHLLCSSKKGFSAHQIHRLLGVTYKSAWFMMHRIRHAMAVEPLASKLSGIVEADEVYIGGKSKNMHAKVRKEKIQGRGPVNKMPVFTLVARGGNVKTTHVANVTADNLKEVLKKHVEAEAHLKTDESSCYNAAAPEFASHESVNHSQGEYVRDEAHVNTAECVHSILKRGVFGVYHHWSEKHLHRYLSEFDFRFNLRKVKDGERTLAAIKSVEGKRLMYKEPVKFEKSEMESGSKGDA